jgi:site-specific DNA recombinase
MPSKHGAILRGLLYCIPCGTAMMHTYTAKGNRRYRYYVCLNAQQRGWSACPTKSINAHDIESFIVERIHGIGSSQEIIAETVKRVRARTENRLTDLNRERRIQKKQLRRLHLRLRKLIGEPAEISVGGPAIDQLADLQDQIRSAEQRMTEIEDEIITLQREAVDKENIAQSLSAFKPIWESLNSREQSRIIKLLVERIGYDGRDGSVKVTFRSLGIKALCERKGQSTGEELR